MHKIVLLPAYTLCSDMEEDTKSLHTYFMETNQLGDEAMALSEQQKAELHALDPRPDLTKDHRLWVAVLMVANRIVGRELDALESIGEDPHVWKSIAGNLHGLRCYGAQLERRGNGTFKLDYKPVAEQIAWERDCTVAEAEQYVLETYLEPHKVQIKAIFDRTIEVARLARKGRRVG